MPFAYSSYIITVTELLVAIKIQSASQSVSAIAWVSSGTLVVASGNQLRCYSKWMNATKLRQGNLILIG